MALTDSDTIKKIIQNDNTFIPTIFNERIVFNLFDKQQLPNSNVVENSESVKIIRANEPILDATSPITLTDQDPKNLSYTKIVWDSVVVADSLLLNTVYVENDDYIVDYFNGTIERTSLGSSIPSGGQVYVWVIPFILLSNGSDYNIDYNTGELNRRAGSSITNKATAYVDYTHSQNIPLDSTIDECIYEMESFIENKLKSGFSLNSDDRALKSAATNFTLYLICLAQAFKELTTAGRSTSDDIAKQWFSLSGKYLDVSKDLFGPYLSTSTKSIGGLIQNRFVTNRSRSIQSPSVPVSIRRH